MITFANNGKDIIKTNYWEHKNAVKGEFFLSFNAGCFRLLVPNKQEHLIDEMKTGYFIEIQRDHDAIVIIFDDNTDMPFTITMDYRQADSFPPFGENYTFSLWIKSGKQKEFKARFTKHG